MSFILLVVEEPGDRQAVSVAEGHRRYDRMAAFGKGLGPRLRAVESLLTDASAVRVSKRGGKTATLDGPFAEAKEMVGGFFLLDVATRAEALAVAKDCPAAEWAIIEVREVGPCWAESDPAGLAAMQQAGKPKAVVE